MKKLILLFSFFVFLSSCKKQYNCFCNTTAIYPYGYGQSNYTSTNKPLTEKLTEKQANAVCDHEADNINETYKNYWTVSGGSLNDVSFTTHCTLQ